MEHHWFADRLSAWLDMGLPVMEQSAMDEHVAGCAECQAQLERLRSLDRLVKNHSQLNSDDPYFDSLASRTEERLFGPQEVKHKPPNVTAIPWWRWTAIAAGVILTSVVSWRVFDEQPKVQELSIPALPSESTQSKPLAIDSLSLSRVADSLAATKQSEEALPKVQSTSHVTQGAKDSEVSAEKVVESSRQDRSEAESDELSNEAVSPPDQVTEKSPNISPSPSVEGKISQIEKKPVSNLSDIQAPSAAPLTAPLTVPSSSAPASVMKKEREVVESQKSVANEAMPQSGERSGDTIITQAGVQITNSKSKMVFLRGDRKQDELIGSSSQLADSIGKAKVNELRRLLSKFRSEPDTTLQSLYRDSIQSHLVQHPPLPPDLMQQLDSLGFRR